jgi:hypothetical protein
MKEVTSLLHPLPRDDLHILVDALFPTLDAINTASSLNVCLTWSQNSQHQLNLFKVLSDGLKKKQWRMACCSSGDNLPDRYFFVYSDSKIMMGYCCCCFSTDSILGGSTGFQLPAQEIPRFNECIPEIARDLYRLEKSSLVYLVNLSPDCSLSQCGTSKSSMVSHITGIPPEHWAKTHPWIGKNVSVVCFVCICICICMQLFGNVRCWSLWVLVSILILFFEIFDKKPWIGKVTAYHKGLFTVFFPKD